MNEFSFLTNFTVEQQNEIIKIVDKLLEKERKTNEKLLKIQSYNILENKSFEKDFELIKNNSILADLKKHLEIIYKINQDYYCIYNSLILINRIFPEDTDIIYKEISLTFFKKFSFPHNFMKLILDNFSSEIDNNLKNTIIYKTNYEKFYRNKFNKKGVNYINYPNFIEKKILMIMQFGTNHSNSKAVNVSTTYKFGRRGNK